VVAWAVLAARHPELVLPSPVETGRALVDLAQTGVVVTELLTTLARAVIGVAVAVAAGVAWGALNGLSTWASATSKPALATLMALPPVVLVVIGLTWFGPGASTTRLVVILVAIPLIVIAVEEAIRNINPDLIEMAAAFSLGRRRTLRHVIAPAIASPVLAATTVALGQSLRVAVMAELLSAADGVGAEVAQARANLATADVFAWAIVLVAVVLTIELTALRPLTNRLLRWRTPT
jgi:NitT/TauT family transport system permease protein